MHAWYGGAETRLSSLLQEEEGGIFLTNCNCDTASKGREGEAKTFKGSEMESGYGG